MNIFVLDRDPVIAAQLHCDKHVVKMILETAQLLSTAHRILDGDITGQLPDEARDGILYRSTHQNHPSAIWARASSENYRWLVRLLRALCDEYHYRYGQHKRNPTHHKVVNSGLLNQLETLPENITDDAQTEFPQCMPDEYKDDDVVKAYRKYYLGEKANILIYTTRPTPEWIK